MLRCGCGMAGKALAGRASSRQSIIVPAFANIFSDRARAKRNSLLVAVTLAARPRAPWGS